MTTRRRDLELYTSNSRVTYPTATTKAFQFALRFFSWRLKRSMATERQRLGVSVSLPVPWMSIFTVVLTLRINVLGFLIPHCT